MLSRRDILKTGAGASAGIAGALAGAGMGTDGHAWPPGPSDTPPVRDIRPGATPIRIAINIRRNEGESPEEMILRRKRDGYSALKGARHAGGNVGEPWHSMTAAERREVVEACRKHDMVIYEVGGYTNLIYPDSSRREKNLAGLAHCIEVAESVECRMVGTVSGTRASKNLIVPHPDNWTLETWKILVNSVKQVLKDTSGMKAVIGMEAQVTTNIDCPLAHKRLMEDVGSDRLKVNLDPFNMMSLAKYYHSTDLVNECFDQLGEDIMGCHAKDAYVIPDKQTVHVQEVCPGRGVFDYEQYLARMSRLAWPRAIEAEHIPDEQYPEAKAYIETVARRIGVKIYGA